MTSTKNDPHKLYLYAQHTDTSHEDSDPPIRIELLRRRDVKAAATLAQIALSLPVPPRFCWDTTSAWLDCHPGIPGIYAPAFANASDLIDALPGLQMWLEAWSTSAGRVPVPAPAWATHRNLDATLVKHFARLVEQHLSAPKTRHIRFCDANGHEVALSIPPKASLSLPPLHGEVHGAVHVVGKEDVACCCLPTGAEVLLSTRVVGGSSQPIVVDPRYLRTITVTSAGRIRPLPSGGCTEMPL